MGLVIHFLIFVGASLVSAQSLLNATSAYPQLSNFTQLLSASPDAAASYITNITSGSQKQTILIPNNDAFNNYQKATGNSVGSLSSSDLGNIFDYHSLQGALSSSDLQTPGGLVSQTALTDPLYDNRELSSDGAKPAQVVYISSTNTTSGAKISARQAGGLSSVGVKSGKGGQINVEPTTGRWSGGNFYIVDGFLTLPENQTKTMTAQGLTSFVLGLDRTNVTDPTNAAQGLTCVCPVNEAFAAMGNLAMGTGNLSDGPASLLATLTRHALTGSFYSTNFTNNFLTHSQNGYPILVTRINGSIFLNDAKIVNSNSIANTGCVHGLDRIMGFLNTTTNITTPANASIYSNTSNIPSPTPVAAFKPGGGSGSTSSASSATATGSSTGKPTGTASGSAASPSSTSAGYPKVMAYGLHYLFPYIGAMILVSGGLLVL